MCGRFALGANADELAVDARQQYFIPPPPARGRRAERAHDEQQGQRRSPEEASEPADAPAVDWASSEAQSSFRPRYNVAPTTQVPVLRRNVDSKAGSTYQLDLLKWGLVPHWYSEPPAPGLSTINATCESVFQGTPAWRGPRQNKRCVVLAQGFYEWLDKGREKQPYFVKRKDGKMMAFAGLWDHCDFKGHHEPVTSFTILTVPVNDQLRFLHTRMPAILDTPSQVAAWLSPAPWSDKLQALIRPFEGELDFYPVDRGVGKVQNDSEEFIKPLTEKKGSLDQFFAKQQQHKQQKAPPSGSSADSKTSPEAKSKSEAKVENDPPVVVLEPDRGTTGKKEEEKEEQDAEALNPDEDADPRKLRKVEAAVEDDDDGGDGIGAQKRKRKRKGRRGGSSDRAGREEGKAVPVIELDRSSDEEAAKPRAAASPDSGSPSTKRRKATAESSDTSARDDVKHTDGKGNETLTDFFSVEEKA
ncbi:hypothetical protein JCM8202_002950 [Rhodotorula sphaerocarpa]